MIEFIENKYDTKLVDVVDVCDAHMKTALNKRIKGKEYYFDNGIKVYTPNEIVLIEE